MSRRFLHPESKKQWLVFYWVLFVASLLVVLLNLGAVVWFLFYYRKLAAIFVCLIVASLQSFIGALIYARIKALAQSQANGVSP